jgi:hypothetical protein
MIIYLTNMIIYKAYSFVSSQQKGKNGDLLHLLRIIMWDGLLISYNNSAG